LRAQQPHKTGIGSRRSVETAAIADSACVISATFNRHCESEDGAALFFPVEPEVTDFKRLPASSLEIRQG